MDTEDEHKALDSSLAAIKGRKRATLPEGVADLWKYGRRRDQEAGVKNSRFANKELKNWLNRFNEVNDKTTPNTKQVWPALPVPEIIRER